MTNRYHLTAWKLGFQLASPLLSLLLISKLPRSINSSLPVDSLPFSILILLALRLSSILWDAILDKTLVEAVTLPILVITRIFFGSSTGILVPPEFHILSSHLISLFSFFPPYLNLNFPDPNPFFTLDSSPKK